MNNLRLKTYNVCAFYYGTINYLKPVVVLFLSKKKKKRGLSPEGFIGNDREPGLRYRGALRLTVDGAVCALKVLAGNLPRRTI
jgi:hypothetical protein